MKYNSKTLDELCDVKIGRTPPRNQSEWFNSGASDDWKWVSIKDMGNCGKFITETSETITNKAKKTFNYATVASGTILLSFKLTLGRVVICDGEFVTNEAIAQLPIKDPSIIDRDYLYYYLKNYNWSNIGSTSSIATAVNSKMVKSIKIVFPDLETQKKIVRVLSALDQKIELNNQQNEKLMETAFSFYRDLLNKQDKNWGLGYIDDGKMTKITKSGISEYSGTKKYVATADVSGTNIIHFEKVKYNDKPSRANMTPKENTVWFAKMEGSIKNILVADFSTDLIGDYIFSTGFMGIECLNDFTYFMWCYINDEKFFDIKNSLSTGTLMAGISNSTIKNAKYLIPPQNLLTDFNTKVKPMLEKIHNNGLQNETLAKMRDSLLPKLMSGEINLDEVTINE